MRITNRELGRERFRWVIVSDEGGVLHGSSGIPVETHPVSDDVPDAAILLASYQPDRSATETTLSWLRRLDRRGCLLGCVDTGALAFARAGLLQVRPAAAHPEAIAGFSRQFPQSLFIDRLYDFSPPRFSSAGGVSTLDMTLALIGHFTSERLARRVAGILTYQRPPADWSPVPPQGGIAPSVRDAVAIMDANLSGPVSISDIATRLDLPLWKLNRLFRRHLHASPTTYYVDRRLARARDMLKTRPCRSATSHRNAVTTMPRSSRVPTGPGMGWRPRKTGSESVNNCRGWLSRPWSTILQPVAYDDPLGPGSRPGIRKVGARSTTSRNRRHHPPERIPGLEPGPRKKRRAIARPLPLWQSCLAAESAF